MEVYLEGIGKRFRRQWLYRNLNLTLVPGKPLAITGANGSGKSTLLQIISGYLSPSEGKVRYVNAGNDCPRDDIFQSVAIASPHLELPGQLTLKETILFHHKLCPIPGFTSAEEAAEEMQLSGNLGKQLRSFSSGMRQRVKLFLAIKNEGEILLLDEPTANLDARGIAWFHHMMQSGNHDQRVVAICTNMREEELSLCSERLLLEDFS